MTTAKEQTPLNFDDLQPKFERFTLYGKPYILREASGGAVCQWRNAQMSQSKMNADGKTVTVGAIADTEPLLVSLCLFEIVMHNDRETERGVPAQVIKGWPYRVQRSLFDRVREMSDLNDKETPESIRKRMADDKEKLEKLEGQPQEEPAKNGQSSMTVGSV